MLISIFVNYCIMREGTTVKTHSVSIVFAEYNFFQPTRIWKWITSSDSRRRSE